MYTAIEHLPSHLINKSALFIIMCKNRLQSKYLQSIFYNHYEKNFENNAIGLEHNEILNRIVQRIITSALTCIKKTNKNLATDFT